MFRNAQRAARAGPGSSSGPAEVQRGHRSEPHLAGAAGSPGALEKSIDVSGLGFVSFGTYLHALDAFGTYSGTRPLQTLLAH